MTVGSDNRNKVFSFTFLDLAFLQILDHFPEKLDLFQSPPRKLTYLYQKFDFIAISRCGKGINDEECGGPRLGADSTVCSGSRGKRQTLSLGSLDYVMRHALCPMRTSE
jgi:hypothetical protein